MDLTKKEREAIETVNTLHLRLLGESPPTEENGKRKLNQDEVAENALLVSLTDGEAKKPIDVRRDLVKHFENDPDVEVPSEDTVGRVLAAMASEGKIWKVHRHDAIYMLRS